MPRRGMLNDPLLVHNDNAKDAKIGKVWGPRKGIRMTVYKCRSCPHVSKRRTNIQDHEKLHKGGGKFNCTECTYSCNNGGALSAHVKVHDGCLRVKKNGKSKKKRDKCRKTRPSPPPLSPPLTNMEKRNAKKDVKMFCQLCPFMSLRRDCMEKHQRRHFLLSGLKNKFGCEHCDYSSRQKNGLLEHKRVHIQTLHRPQPEAFMLVQGLEILVKYEDSDTVDVAFKDCEDGTFEPPVSDGEGKKDGGDNSKMNIDVNSGEFVEEEEGS